MLMKISLCVVAVCATAGLPVVTQGAIGTVRYFQLAGPNWDPYTSSTDPNMQLMIRNNVARMGTYTPYFDSKLSWMPRTYVYFDSYAIYTNSALATQHPEWILKDSLGNKLYIPWGCSGGTCPQYAGDISNPAFRAWQVSQVQTTLKGNGSTPYGYLGLWFDDVNLTLTVGNGNGNFVAPIDTHTRQPMTQANWQLYFAQYLELVRNSLPWGTEILHNTQWGAGNASNTSIRREMAAANLVNLERGFGDPGITGGTGQWSLNNLMLFIDSVHSVGSGVVIEDYYLANQMYSLSCYFLIQNGDDDYFGINEQTPGNWPASLYTINLGAATDARHKWLNLWRRDFANGFVLVNEPGSPTQVITLPAGMVDTNGNAVSVVTLGASQGGIYMYSH